MRGTERVARAGRGRRLAALALLLGALSVLADCSARSRRNQSTAFTPITVHVDNQNFNDVTVYLVWRSDRRRLGSVGGHTRASFTSPWYGPELQVELDVLAGSRIRGDRVAVNPGDEMVIEIPSAAERFRVYRR
jgi:hypothetical protein